MSDDSLKPSHWYWIRREDGSLAPYRFHRLHANRIPATGEFFVGSFIRHFPLSAIVGEAQMPDLTSNPSPSGTSGSSRSGRG